MRLEIPRELKSPNKWLWKHWRVKQRERAEWEQEIWAVLVQRKNTLFYKSNREPRRVTVTRYMPSSRNLIKDDDNLRFAVKPLNDALKGLGLIHDDSREWLEQPMPTQIVSDDKQWRTVIEIEPVRDGGTTEGR